ncbi:hypothetical protein GQ607_006548 [Colletotrichum asianum]|uniref:Uncharacterized protein n=1 Tax=Colletotrichum asianum TaxID=702518 RepID=A0A8H3WH98_9PEZI|nr:hypothetical protein GQ607_006548 [Colletotrichum asianum]
MVWEGVCVGEESVLREGEICRGSIRYSTVSATQKVTSPAKLPGPVYPLQVASTLRTLLASAPPIPLPGPSLWCQPNREQASKSKMAGPGGLSGMCGTVVLLADMACLAMSHGKVQCRPVKLQKPPALAVCIVEGLSDRGCRHYPAWRLEGTHDARTFLRITKYSHSSLTAESVALPGCFAVPPTEELRRRHRDEAEIQRGAPTTSAFCCMYID